MRRTPKGASRRSAGFSLVEVMVAVIVLCVGLLGIARMQSLALSSTSVANKRSLAAIEADSMAGAMHENRGYWTSSDTANAIISITGTTLSFTNAPNLAAAGTTVDCTATGGPCTPTNLAAFDLNAWAQALQALLPNDSATINCGALTPISCTITITWSERAVAINAQEAQQAGNTAAVQVPTYTLYVQP